jgi:hypothetical protein
MVIELNDRFALLLLCQKVEEYRKVKEYSGIPYLFKREFKPVGTIMVQNTSYTGSDYSTISFGGSAFEDKCKQKFVSRQGTIIDPFEISVVMFLENTWNRIIEIVYGLYLRNKKDSPYELFLKIIVHGKFNDQEESTDPDVIKEVALNFLNELKE